MDDRTARLFSALGVLVVVWIVVYWSWPVGEPAVTASIDEPDLGSIPPAVSAEPRAEVSTPGTGALSDTRDDTGSAAEPGLVIPPEFEAYVIQPGDLGWEPISKRVYGTSRHWGAVARANPLQDPLKLRVGQTIRVPKDPANVQGRPAGEETPTPAPEPVTIEYTVRSGDTLSGIAKAIYGSVRHTDYLFEANRDRLRSKNDLRLGQVLLIPPLPPAGED